MRQYNVHEAKTRFSKILAQVQAGETVVIAKNGRRVAKVIPFRSQSRPRRAFGSAKGLVRLSKGWEGPLPESILRSFEP